MPGRRRERMPVETSEADLYLKMISAHQKRGRLPVQLLRYAPDDVIRKLCNICHQALHGSNVYFTKPQQTRLQKYKAAIRKMADERLPFKWKRGLIQRGGAMPAALVAAMPWLIKAGVCLLVGAASAGVGAAVSQGMANNARIRSYERQLQQAQQANQQYQQANQRYQQEIRTFQEYQRQPGRRVWRY